MSGKDLVLDVMPRTVEGKAVKGLRRTGQTPAVIHDHGKESKVIQAPYTEVNKVYHAAGKHHPITLTLGSEKFMTIIKDVDFDTKTMQIRHVVFNAIKQNEKVETEVPLHLVGEIPAEKAGLMVIRQLDSVEISALPKDLIDSLEIDASGLTEIGDKLYVSDIVAPSGVTILTEAEHPIATVEETKAQMSEEAAEEEAAPVDAAEVPSAHGSADSDTPVKE